MLRSGRTPKELAKRLGVSEQTLRNWRRQTEADRRERSDVPTSAELEELRRLRKENARLKQERDRLKRAAGLLRRGERAPVTAYQLISAEKARTPICLSCRLLGVSRSGSTNGPPTSPPSKTPTAARSSAGAWPTHAGGTRRRRPRNGRSPAPPRAWAPPSQRPRSPIRLAGLRPIRARGRHRTLDGIQGRLLR
jgi:transposase